MIVVKRYWRQHPVQPSMIATSCRMSHIQNYLLPKKDQQNPQLLMATIRRELLEYPDIDTQDWEFLIWAINNAKAALSLAEKWNFENGEKLEVMLELESLLLTHFQRAWENSKSCWGSWQGFLDYVNESKCECEMCTAEAEEKKNKGEKISDNEGIEKYNYKKKESESSNDFAIAVGFLAASALFVWSQW